MLDNITLAWAQYSIFLGLLNIMGIFMLYDYQIKIITLFCLIKINLSQVWQEIVVHLCIGDPNALYDSQQNTSMLMFLQCRSFGGKEPIVFYPF